MTPEQLARFERAAMIMRMNEPSEAWATGRARYNWLMHLNNAPHPDGLELALQTLESYAEDSENRS